MTLSPEQIKNALEQPELAAHLADLVYIQDQHFTIYRKKRGRDYSYLLDNKTRPNSLKWPRLQRPYLKFATG